MREIPFERKIEMLGEILDLVGHHDDVGMLGERALQPRRAAFRRADDEEVGARQVGETRRAALDAAMSSLRRDAIASRSRKLSGRRVRSFIDLRRNGAGISSSAPDDLRTLGRSVRFGYRGILGLDAIASRRGQERVMRLGPPPRSPAKSIDKLGKLRRRASRVKRRVAAGDSVTILSLAAQRNGAKTSTFPRSFAPRQAMNAPSSRRPASGLHVPCAPAWQA